MSFKTSQQLTNTGCNYFFGGDNPEGYSCSTPQFQHLA